MSLSVLSSIGSGKWPWLPLPLLLVLPDIKMVARTPAAKDTASDANITEDDALTGIELRVMLEELVLAF